MNQAPAEPTGSSPRKRPAVKELHATVAEEKVIIWPAIAGAKAKEDSKDSLKAVIKAKERAQEDVTIAIKKVASPDSAPNRKAKA